MSTHDAALLPYTPLPWRADEFYGNLYMARVGGIGVAEMNKLEIELCIRLDWHLIPSAAQMHDLRRALVDGPRGNAHWDSWRSSPAAAPTHGVECLAEVRGSGTGHRERAIERKRTKAHDSAPGRASTRQKRLETPPDGAPSSCDSAASYQRLLRARATRQPPLTPVRLDDQLTTS